MKTTIVFLVLSWFASWFLVGIIDSLDLADSDNWIVRVLSYIVLAYFWGFLVLLILGSLYLWLFK